MCGRGGASGDASGVAIARGAFAEGLPRAPEASRNPEVCFIFVRGLVVIKTE